MEKLAADDYEYLLNHVAANPNTPVYLLEKFAVDEKDDVRKAAAKNPNTPVSVLEKLAIDEVKYVRMSVAKNPNPHVHIFEKLALDEESVRYWVATNPNTPVSILEKLAVDKNGRVRTGAAENPNTPASALDKLAVNIILEKNKEDLESNTKDLEKNKKVIHDNPVQYICLKLENFFGNLIENNKDFLEENAFKVRPGIAYDKFYLNWIDGSYDMSLQGLIHHYMWEQELYHLILNEDEIKTCEAVVENSPESIYGAEDEGTQTMLDEIQSDTIKFVGKKLIDLGFDLKKTFKEYLE